MADDHRELGKILALRGVTWEWRDDAPDEAKGFPGLGIIAQDVERVFPQLVDTGEDGIKRVQHYGLIGPLIEAVKALDARLTALESGAVLAESAGRDSSGDPPGIGT
jgi:hypothetical protein